MPVRQLLHRGGAPIKIFTDDVDQASIEQLGAVSRLPIIAGHVAAMPDVHLGIRATVGSVIPTSKALIPAAVGVDIGCGMAATRLSLRADQLPDNLRPVREAIENAVPLGKSAHARPAGDRAVLEMLQEGLTPILERHARIRSMVRNIEETTPAQVGTLGGGNHFIEVRTDGAAVWIMLHSGGRRIGDAIGTYFTQLARKDMERQRKKLPAKDLAYIEEGADHFTDYVEALGWAQRYALENRRLMMKLVIAAIRPLLPPFRATETAIECHHNYVAQETHFGREIYVTRKGAIRAGRGDLGIIPGSMGARSYIVRGLGNTDAIDSCAHGAGRRLSRSAAKRHYTTADLERQTAGIECRKDTGVLDEIPAAYKDIDTVMANSSDLVEILHTLRQVVCVKG